MALRNWLTALVALGVTTLGASNARAQGITRTFSNFVDSILDGGLRLQLGGGAFGFTDPQTTQFTSPGGSWTVRMVLGSNAILGGELAYIGSAQGIDAEGLDRSTTLVSNGVEGVLRLNATASTIQPYAVAGFGWRHFSLAGNDFNNSVVAERDSVLEIPLGIGISGEFGSFIADLRGMFRPTIDNELILVPRQSAELHNWEAQASIGVEF